MGSRFFEDCGLEDRFTLDRRAHRFGTLSVVYDWDQRRTITVTTSWEQEDGDFIFEAISKHIDSLPANAFEFAISRNGELLSWSSNSDTDRTRIPFYPSDANFPGHLRKIRRSDLTEINRFGLQVDLVTYESLPGQIRRAVFKYYINSGNITAFWNEINCIIRIPQHPNIVTLDSLVIETVDGEEKVVGFTTPFIPGGTILHNVSRVFKLEHLKQLIKAIDYLNLALGVVHGDIGPGNLLIDPETDNLQVFDFNWCERPGKPDYEEDRNDVKYVTLALYEIIARDLHFREENYPEELDSSMWLEMEAWEQHSDVQLDCSVSDYRQVLDDWVKRRDMTLSSQGPDVIDWPPVPEFPLVTLVGWVPVRMLRQPWQIRQDLVSRGVDVVKWQRPGTSQLPLPEGKRLLATGEIVDDDKETLERP